MSVGNNNFILRNTAIEKCFTVTKVVDVTSDAATFENCKLDDTDFHFYLTKDIKEGYDHYFNIKSVKYSNKCLKSDGKFIDCGAVNPQDIFLFGEKDGAFEVDLSEFVK